MYESHFGFTASPFQLNPDPDFYFDSRGHHKALAHLRYGLQQGEGFILITGEVGTGKTTLVRALLQQLDARELVAAQISNSQLDADNLLQTILTSFGVPAQGMSKAGMIARLEAFLTSIAASGRRALLVIDEAQNLSAQALEELRMLSNFQLGSHALLQSFLVGQPELRQLLQSPSMQQLQQRILASYHLEPLDAEETAAYVVHRLRHVGWTGQRPAIGDEALQALYGCTGGVPRRINLLCNRLLLAAYLSQTDSIAAALVNEIADEMSHEVSAPAQPAVSGSRPLPAVEQPVAGPAEGSVEAPPRLEAVASNDLKRDPRRTLEGQPAEPRTDASRPSEPAARAVPAAQSPASLPGGARKYKLAAGALLAVAGDALAWGQLQLLCRHWKQASGAAQPMAMVHPGAVRSDIPAAWREHDSGYPPAPCVYLECPQAPEGRRAAALAVRLAELIAEVQPSALVVAGNSFDLVHLVLMARQLKLPVIRLAAGEPDGSDLDEPVLACDLMNRSADLLCVPSVTDHQRLLTQGIASWRVARVAPMTSALLRATAPSWPSVADTWAELNLPSEILSRNPRGYALLTAQVSRGDLAPLDLMQWLMVVRHAQDELPLIWLADPATADALAEPVLRKPLRNSGVVVATVKGVHPKWSLLRQARCVIAGPGQELVEEAQLLGVPSVAVHLHGDRRANWMGFGVAQVGPSKAQFMAAVRAAVRMPREVRDPASLGESAVWDVTAQIQHWLNHRDALPFQLHAQTAAA